MKKIFKYQLDITDVQDVELPKGATILSVITQRNAPVIYVQVDTEENVSEKIRFFIVGTGNPADHVCNDSTVFMGTVETRGGILVWHIFYEKLVGG